MKCDNTYFTGNGVVPGIAIGRAYVLSKRSVSPSLKHITEHEVEFEIKRFEAAVERSYAHLESIKAKIDSHYHDPGHIIEAQQLMLKDEELRLSVCQAIEQRLVNVEWALTLALQKYEEVFAGVEDEYLRERFADIHHLVNNLQRNLSGAECVRLEPPPDAVVVADEISPAEAIQLGRAAISALVTQKGGRTSHTVIIAKSFEIPCVVGVKEIVQDVGTGDLVLVDGAEGSIILNPCLERVQEYRLRMHKNFALEQSLISQSRAPATTLDGETFSVYANIDFSEEADTALSHGAEGIGLYRTEFLFISKLREALDEEVHYHDTKKLLSLWGSGPLTIRTFDLGSDKFPIIRQEIPLESNPALGLRSIRLSLVKRDIFKKQLRGILRAWVQYPETDLRFMFPLISGYDEFMLAKEVLIEAQTELEAQGHEIPEPLCVGSMIELPSAAMQADLLATECDFFSIGSNDLTQYAIAVDRNNDAVSHLFNPLNVGVLRLMKRVIECGQAAGIPVSICGDMATDPIAALVLMGMGMKIFSVPPGFIPHVKRLIRSVKREEITRLTRQGLGLKSGHSMEKLFREALEPIIAAESPHP